MGGVRGGVSPLQPTKGSGGASWAPPAGSGSKPRPKTDFGVFWRPQWQNAHFCTYMTKSGGTICISVPRSKFWGDLIVPLSLPPVIYAHAHYSRSELRQENDIIYEWLASEWFAAASHSHLHYQCLRITTLDQACRNGVFKNLAF